jgi:hypothetical protein
MVNAGRLAGLQALLQNRLGFVAHFGAEVLILLVIRVFLRKANRKKPFLSKK